MRQFALFTLLTALLCLAACAGFGDVESRTADELLDEARARLREITSFSLVIQPRGDATPLSLQFAGFNAALSLIRADVQFVRPDALWMDARLSAGPVTLDLALFMLAEAQFYRLPGLSWQSAELAPDFTPAQLLTDNGILDRAIHALQAPETIGVEYLADGQPAQHLRARAAGAEIAPLLFDLVPLSPTVLVDLWLDRERNHPLRIELYDIDTGHSWRLDFYDYNRAPRFKEAELPLPFTYDRRDFTASARPPARNSTVTMVLLAVVTLVTLSFAALALALRRRREPSVHAAPATHPPARRAWRVLIAALIPLFIGSLDLTVVSAFLPELIIDLNLPLQSASDDALWVLSGYLLAYMVSLVFVGRASDLLGRRPVYVVSLSLFFIGSLWVAQANGPPYIALEALYARLGLRLSAGEIGLQSIILGRLVQALGAGALVPVSLALVSDLFPARRRARAFGILAAVDTLGWVLGHLYGGLLIAAFASPAGRALENFVHSLGADWFALNWQTLFWVNLPLTLLALWVVLSGLRGIPERRARGRFDYWGAALLSATLISLIIGLGANIDPASGNLAQAALPTYALPLLAFSALCLAAFVFWAGRSAKTLFDWRHFRRPPLAAASAVNLLVGFSLMIGLVSVPTLVNVSLESTAELAGGALRVGLLLSALTVPMALAAYPGGRWTERHGPSRVTQGGLLLAAFGFLLIWRSWGAQLNDVWIALELAIVGLGLGLTLAPISNASLNAARESERGLFGALVILLRLLGMALSTALLSNYALSRINARTIAEFGATLDPMLYADTYARIAIAVVAELGLIGALVCVLALLPAGRLGHSEGN